MYLYVTIVFMDGYDGSSGEIVGHYRTLEDAKRQGEKACVDADLAVFNVYRVEY